MKTGRSILLLLTLTVTVMAQEEVSAPLPENSRFALQLKDARTKVSSMANKTFDAAAFNTKMFNTKSAGLTGHTNNFSFPNNAFAKQFQTGAFRGFGGNFNTPTNQNFATDQVFDLDRQPFSSKVLDQRADRDSERTFTAQDWRRRYQDDGKLYQGRELTELGSYSGKVVLQNKDDMMWGQETLSSAQIKAILNKNK